jgi:hypothetical protein
MKPWFALVALILFTLTLSACGGYRISTANDLVRGANSFADYASVEFSYAYSGQEDILSTLGPEDFPDGLDKFKEKVEESQRGFAQSAKHFDTVVAGYQKAGDMFGAGDQGTYYHMKAEAFRFQAEKLKLMSARIRTLVTSHDFADFTQSYKGLTQQIVALDQKAVAANGSAEVIENRNKDGFVQSQSQWRDSEY